jgi:4-alpha-glucanotransferase
VADDYTLFMALKEAHGGVSWTGGNAPCDGACCYDALAKKLAPHRISHLPQYQFSVNGELEGKCHHHSIQLFGDMPIFVAHDSADVWAHRLFYPGCF